MPLTLRSMALALAVTLPAADAAGQTVVRGTFDQTRTLKGHTSPLSSRGTFSFSADEGLIWHVTSPVEVMTIMSPRGLAQSVGDAAPTHLPAGQVPMFAMFRAMIAAAITGELDSLSGTFTLERTEDSAGAFTAVLTPKGEGGAGRLPVRQLVLTGRTLIETATIHKTNGDTDQIAFLDQRRDTGGLNDAEKKLIALSSR